MKNSKLLLYLFAIGTVIFTSIGLSQSLKLSTINLWTGLNYRGSFSMGEYETADVREKRKQILLEGLKQRQPDIIAVQEVNPVAALTAHIADVWDLSNDFGIFGNASDGLFASDHFGLAVAINCARMIEAQKYRTAVPAEDKIEWLPILMYDTDVGFGYGVKGFLLNQFQWSESFDVLAFNSTKGERWYRFVFSLPDFELRQGTLYPLSFDLIVDYDKYLNNNFYGLGNASSDDDRETYTKEPLDIVAMMGRGFSQQFVGQAGIKYRTVRSFNFESNSLFARTLPAINKDRSSGFTLMLSARYDSRDSYINPSHGQVLQGDIEMGSRQMGSDYSLVNTSITFQTFHVLGYPKIVFAGRVIAQRVSGENIPIHSLVSVGGGKTLRGYPQDRFLDKVGIVLNGELRFPIYWRFGGVVGLDAGNVWQSADQVNLRQWPANTLVGLRFTMETFLVRMDLGFSNETTGFYLNFGHAF
ncbi:MAG: BamA/TamA family outer membrane protein [bacterium]